MNVCREMEKKYGLIAATDKQHREVNKVFTPIDYKSGDVKSQIASVVRHLPNSISFKLWENIMRCCLCLILLLKS